jgi:hypothetical protein
LFRLPLLLLEGDDYERAAQRALKLIETCDRILWERASSTARIRPVKNWEEGIKELTDETRLARAETKFVEAWERLGKRPTFVRALDPRSGDRVWVRRSLEDWRKTGFAQDDLEQLQHQFSWLASQRRKISEKSSWTAQMPRKPGSMPKKRTRVTK